MAQKKSVKKPSPKKGIELVKLSSLPKAEILNINLEDLWVMRPETGAVRPRPRYCRCRNICIV
jgi:hypothetical protein